MIRTRDLSKTFAARGGPVEAVRGIDLTVEPGEIFGFLGPNGAGKTTTLRMLATLIAPSGGTAEVAGADLLTAPGLIRERIGYVAQGGGSDPQETGRRELVIQARPYGMGR
jgi:ABC-2 type transport system ATP-binding protein